VKLCSTTGRRANQDGALMKTQGSTKDGRSPVAAWLRSATISVIVAISLATVAPGPAQDAAIAPPDDDPGVLVRIDLPRGRESLVALDGWMAANGHADTDGARHVSLWDRAVGAVTPPADDDAAATLHIAIDETAATTFFLLDPTRTIDPWLVMLAPRDGDHAALAANLEAAGRLTRRVGHRVATTSAIRSLDRGLVTAAMTRQPRYDPDRDVLVVTVYPSEFVGRLRHLMRETLPQRAVAWAAGRSSVPAGIVRDGPTAAYTLERVFDLAEQIASIELRLRTHGAAANPDATSDDWSWLLTVEPHAATTLQRWADWRPPHDNTGVSRLGVPYAGGDQAERELLLAAELPWWLVGQAFQQLEAEVGEIAHAGRELPRPPLESLGALDGAVTGPVIWEECDLDGLTLSSFWFPVESVEIDEWIVPVATSLNEPTPRTEVTAPRLRLSLASPLTAPEDGKALVMGEIVAEGETVGDEMQNERDEDRDQRRLGVLLAMPFEPPRGFLAHLWGAGVELERQREIVEGFLAPAAKAPRAILPGQDATSEQIRLVLVGRAGRLARLLGVDFPRAVQLRLSVWGGDGRLRIELRPESPDV
jgi:hypothetical protein